MGSLATDPRLIAISQALPFARRYARAMLGDRDLGDDLVSVALREVMDALEARSGHWLEHQLPEHLLYSAASRLMQEQALADSAAMLRRQVLLLATLEGLSLRNVARILEIAEAEVATLLEAARHEVRAGVSAATLIIEDDVLIGAHIQRIVSECGHRVVGVAASEAEALKMAQADPPGLILADVNLGRGGDGIEAVARIVQDRPAPAIYVTGQPQSLLTSRGVEPTFIIPKPFTRNVLAAASYQAVSGGTCPIQLAARGMAAAR